MSFTIDSLELKKPSEVLNNPTIEERDTPIVSFDSIVKSDNSKKIALIFLGVAVLGTIVYMFNQKQVI